MILADTHVLVWAVENNPRLGPAARNTLDAGLANDELAVSAITFWEIALLVSKGRLEIDENLTSWRQRLLDAGVVELALDGHIGIQANDLPDLHPDPADRIIVATACHFGATLLTADGRLLQWPGPMQRTDAAN